MAKISLPPEAVTLTKELPKLRKRLDVELKELDMIIKKFKQVMEEKEFEKIVVPLQQGVGKRYKEVGPLIAKMFKQMGR